MPTLARIVREHLIECRAWEDARLTVAANVAVAQASGHEIEAEDVRQAVLDEYTARVVELRRAKR